MIQAGSVSPAAVTEGLGYISVANFHQYLRTAQAAHLPVERLLAELGLSDELLADANGRVPGEKLQAFLSQAIPASGDDLFGLHSSHTIDAGSYSVMGYIAMSSATLVEALMRMPQYEKLVGDMGTSTVEPEPGLVCIKWHCRYNEPLIRRHLVEAAIGSWAVFARWLVDDENANPFAIYFRHSAPARRERLLDYQKIFRCPVYFDQPYDGVKVTMEVLERKIRYHEPHLLHTLENYARDLLGRLRATPSVADRVRDLLRAILGSRVPSREFVADQLGMNVRTLHRRLADEDTSYQRILDELRKDLAIDMISTRNLSVEEISRQLGFSDARCFSRAFKAMTGMTPSEYRQQVRGSQAA